MATKTISGSYPDGYYLDPSFRSLSVEKGATVSGAGVTTTSVHASTIYNTGNIDGTGNGISLSDGGSIRNGNAGASQNSAYTITGVAPVVARGARTTVGNFGTIDSATVRTAYTYYGQGDFAESGYTGLSIQLTEGGTLDNQGSVSNGVSITGGTGAIDNTGSIGGARTYAGHYATKSSYQRSYGASITLTQGGRISNSGTLDDGIYASGTRTTVVNTGKISGGPARDAETYYSAGGYTKYRFTGLSIQLNAGGNITNSGTISNGISIAGGVGVVANSGSIGGDKTYKDSISDGYDSDSGYSAYGPSIRLAQGGRVSNTGSISSGISIAGGRGFVVNSGDIEGPFFASSSYLDGYGTAQRGASTAVVLQAGGVVTNRSGGGIDGIAISGGLGSVYNGGAILDTLHETESSGGVASFTGGFVDLSAGGSVLNGSASNSSAHIDDGVSIAGGGRITNFGSIGVDNIDAYFLNLDAGTVLNEASGTIDGVVLTNATLTNLGTITGYYDNRRGVFSAVLQTGGAVINGSSGRAAASMTNGVSLLGSGSVTNFGAIGDSNIFGAAVMFAEASDTLIEEGTGTLTGTVMGGGGSLVLGRAAGAGTISGLGSTISGFKTVTVQSSATWTVNAAAVIASATTFENDGDVNFAANVTNSGTFLDKGVVDLGTSAQTRLVDQSGATFDLDGGASVRGAGLFGNAGHLVKTAVGTSTVAIALNNTGMVETQAGTLDFAAAVSGTGGTLQIDAHTGLEFDAAVGAPQTVVFNGTRGLMTLKDARAFAAVISGFGSGDTVDLGGFATSGETTSFAENSGGTGGVLTVKSGTNVARLNFSGQYTVAGFHVATDNDGGTDITYAAPATAASDPAFVHVLFEGTMSAGAGTADTAAQGATSSAAAELAKMMANPGASASKA